MTTNRLPSSAVTAGTRPARRGFTLIEIMIVIALIGMLAGASIFSLNRMFGGGQESIAQSFVDTTGLQALMAYRIHMGSYPTTEQGLAALRTAPGNAGSRWKGPYLTKDPLDPWNNPYQYRQPGIHNKDGFDLWSFGPDGKEGGDDIGNWE